MSERADWIVKKVVRKLELKKMQAAKLWAIKHKYFEIRDTKKSERDASFNALTSFITSDDLVKKEVENWMDEGKKSSDEYFTVVFPLVKDFHKSLTKKQKQTAASWMDELRKRFDL